jgi:hypothetical protein
MSVGCSVNVAVSCVRAVAMSVSEYSLSDRKADDEPARKKPNIHAYFLCEGRRIAACPDKSQIIVLTLVVPPT